jgi:hypothetical protein
VDFLASLGLATVYIQGQPAVKMPYFDGAEIGARLRTALEGRNRFRWRKGKRVQPYGLWRIDRSWGAVILCEAAGMTSDLATHLMRSLLSEGKIRHETIERTNLGLQPKLMEREGPTGLILTTTGANLHPENETRMLSLTARDDPLQTAGVLRSLADRARGARRGPSDLAQWHAFRRHPRNNGRLCTGL